MAHFLMTETASPPLWPDVVYEQLRAADVSQFVYVPDAGHQRLIDRSLVDPDVLSLCLTTEAEGVAMLAGADLGGARGVLLMQSSGVGNCVNMFSLITGAHFPFLTLISMRGEFGEGNPWQVPMGQGAANHLTVAGVIVHRVERAQDVAETVAAAAELAFASSRAVAVLVAQRVLGAKTFED